MVQMGGNYHAAPTYIDGYEGYIYLLYFIIFYD